MIGEPTRLTIRRDFPRLDRATVEEFGTRSASFVADAQDGRGCLPFDIRALETGSRFCGSALTCYCGARDNLAAQAALDYLQPGDVLVIATQAFTGTACMGDNMARIALSRGAVAVVSDGLVRDADDIATIGLPVFCRGTTPATTFTNGPGEVGLPVAMGEVTVASGDLILGDRDGGRREHERHEEDSGKGS